MENILSSYGATFNEASEAVKKAMSLLPPIGQTEIELIKHNPSLNWFQKRRLIRFIKNKK